MTPLHWGIAGGSKISHDFIIALRSPLTTTKHKIVAIASRFKDNANVFSTQHDIPRVYGSYEELAKDPEVEVVYVAVLNPHHLAVAQLMIEHRKHVMVEKPFAMNSQQANTLICLAKERRVFLMEGLWSRFFPVYRHLSRLVSLGRFRNIKEVYIKHGFNGIENERIVKREMGGGIVLDIGCYAISLVLLLFREAPKSIKAKGKINTEHVDLYFEADLTFTSGKANIICSGLQELDNQATILTCNGPICIPTYWCPTKYMALNKMYTWHLIKMHEKFNYTNSVGLKYEADEVAKCIRAGKLECNIMSHEETLLIAKIQDEIRKQIGVQYECD